MNKYDDVQLNVASLLAAQAKQPQAYDLNARSADGVGFVGRTEALLARYTTAALYRSGILRRLMYANLKLDWFDEFRRYWTRELGLRRIELHDFYHLAGIYRQRFQALSVSDNASPTEFLRAWQNPASIHLLFHYQYKLALHPLSAYTLAKHIPRGSRVCEYGCGLAPITQSLITFYPGLNLNLTAADIPSFMLHFVAWKYRAVPFVQVLSLDPADDAPLNDTYDVITCMTVLEHLPRPLPIVQHLFDRLRPGGIFMFDYITSEGSGLDTQESLRDRLAVLNFIQSHSTILKGTLATDGRSVGTVIVRKNR